VRSCPGTGCSIVGSLSNGQEVSLVSGESPSADGHQWGKIGEGRWVARTFLTCGGNNPAPPPAGGNSGADSNLGSYPASYTTSGYTYTGRRAQVLHFLKARFTASATTYASHSDGALSSSDLWTSGAAFGRDNGGMASMNSLADYCAGNLNSLGLSYVIWKQRINTGGGWRQMENRGSITQNHFDHVHITFKGDFRATDPSNGANFNESTTPSSIPGWAIGIIVLNIVVVAALAALVVVIVRVRAARDVRE